MRIGYSHEAEPAGTGGAVRLAAERLRADTFLVLNGDSFFDVPLDRFVATHLEQEATLTLALAPTPDPSRYGSVECDAEGHVLRFEEKAGRPTASSGAAWINGGVYVVRRDVLDGIPAGRPLSLEREVFPALIGRGLHGARFDRYFVDIGVPDDYLGVRSAPERLLAAVA